MAKITASDVEHLAALAKLGLNKEEIDKFKTDIEAILGFIDQLQSVDVSDYEPTDQVSGLKNVVRADKVQDFGATPADLKKNSKTEKNQYMVERVLG